MASSTRLGTLSISCTYWRTGAAARSTRPFTIGGPVGVGGAVDGGEGADWKKRAVSRTSFAGSCGSMWVGKTTFGSAIAGSSALLSAVTTLFKPQAYILYLAEPAGLWPIGGLLA